MNLRPARRADAAACAALVAGFLPALRAQAHAPGLARFRASIGERRQAQAIANYRYLVAEDSSGCIVGLAALRPPRHLFHLFVAARAQGRGLGLQLFRAVSEGSEALPLTLNCSLGAIGFYTRLGFRPTQALQVADGITYLPMRRP